MTADTDHQTSQQPFQAEVAELLKLMVHSVYSETDISSVVARITS